MKILIVGGGGFVGSWLTKELVSRKQKVVVIDPFIYFSILNPTRISKIKKFKLNELLNKSKIYKGKFENIGDKVIKKEKPDVVIHLAGIPLEKMDDIEISTLQLTDDIALTYKVIQSVKNNKIKKFVYMSSIAAYGDCDESINENFPLVPKTPYGVMKASGEFLTKSLINNWNIVRSTNIYGFGDMNGRGTNIILNKILNKEKFTVNSGIVMDFINVKDIASGIADVALKAPLGEVFHISGGKALPLIKYVEELGKHFSLDYEIKELHDRPKRGTMNNQKAKRLIGWSPRFSLKTGVENYIEYVKKYKIA